MFGKASTAIVITRVLMVTLTAALSWAASPQNLIAEETQPRGVRGQAQVVARGGFPDLAPRSVEATKRFGAADAASGSAYRINSGHESDSDSNLIDSDLIDRGD